VPYIPAQSTAQILCLSFYTRSLLAALALYIYYAQAASPFLHSLLLSTALLALPLSFHTAQL
jgi:hypothetical protein